MSVAFDIEVRRIVHAYDPNCPDCVVAEWPCAWCRGDCVSCGTSNNLHPVGIVKDRTDRAGRPLVEFMCKACDPEDHSREEWDPVDDRSDIR